MKNVISFFTGAGGLDIGLNQAGFTVKLAVELMPIYCETLSLNHAGLNIRQGNIMDYSREKVYTEAGLEENEEVELMVGGSPCQSFSTAGKRLAFASPGGEAMLKFADLVTEIRPRAFMLENVKGLLSAPLKNRPLNQRGGDYPPLEPEEMRGSALEHLLTRFPEYEVTYKLVNAADYGVPQKRERVFLVGMRRDLNRTFLFPEPTHNELGTDGKKRWVTVRDVFDRLGNIVHHHVNYSQDRLNYMRMIPIGGGNWRNLPDNVVEKAMGGAYASGGGKVGYFRRIHIDKPSPTVLTSPMQKSTNLGHPFEDRPLSIEEYLAIQEFPSNYVVAGRLGDQYTQIGNAVPIRLAKAMGEAILSQIVRDEA
ncbi:Modification methylase HaeIII [Paenibacillus polymyxa E681]|uniref:DNA cytosine methyltransferase n=1 Tax=Paenibacillus polymyxa TaxID=1406 RepID=UPI0001E3218A|nr:DNA cytosine methyltransferase [Paenibacillus polymyxa]ADM72452.1 DNA methyltransferase [Paenibacillus polymyxa E681]QNV59481.1 Modification methylase HaeIII [Paenibacillus polymyxa E681]QNV64307.1 Modification methylase HaeIII [Paenibacillus polymyxa E681]